MEAWWEDAAMPEVSMEAGGQAGRETRGVMEGAERVELMRANCLLSLTVSQALD